jgi:hypothetical protein
MNDITQDHDDDGYSGSLTGGGRLIKGQLIRWNETNGWMDRDGLRPPEIMLAVALSEAIQRWRDKKVVEEITAKPLPDVNLLNEAVPKHEWEPGLDGQPKPPYSHQFVVYLLDSGSGAFFTYLNSTVGARIAHEQLREKVVTMRTLRGTRVVPVVKLTHRPMKTFVGMKHRPEFEIVGWKQLGGEGGTLPSPRAPQLTSPGTAEKPESKSEPASDPTPEPKSKASNAANATLSALADVSEPTTAEVMKDSIPW